MDFVKIIISFLGYTNGIIGAAGASLAGSVLSRRSSLGPHGLGFSVPERGEASFNNQKIHFRDDDTSYIGVVDPEAEFILSDDKERYERSASRYMHNAEDDMITALLTQDVSNKCCTVSVDYEERECSITTENYTTYKARIKYNENDHMLLNIKADKMFFNYSRVMYFLKHAKDINLELKANLALGNFSCVIEGHEITKEDSPTQNICHNGNVENKYVTLVTGAEHNKDSNAFIAAYPVIVDADDGTSSITMICRRFELSSGLIEWKYGGISIISGGSVSVRRFDSLFDVGLCGNETNYLTLRNSALKLPRTIIVEDGKRNEKRRWRCIWSSDDLGIHSAKWYSVMVLDINGACLRRSLDLDNDVHFSSDKDRVIAGNPNLHYDYVSQIIGITLTVIGVVAFVLGCYFKMTSPYCINADLEGFADNFDIANDGREESVALNIRENMQDNTKPSSVQDNVRTEPISDHGPKSVLCKAFIR